MVESIEDQIAEARLHMLAAMDACHQMEQEFWEERVDDLLDDLLHSRPALREHLG